MKVLGIIFLVVIFAVALANMSGSDDSTAAPDTAAQPAAVNTDAARVDELTTRGQELANEIAALSSEGVELTNAGDAAGACGIVDEQIAKLDELDQVVEDLRPIVGAELMVKLDNNEADLRAKIGNTEAICNGMGL